MKSVTKSIKTTYRGMMAKHIRLKDYHVNNQYGFLLESPLEYLPEYFEPWNRLAKTMPELVAQHELRKAVDEMPVLDHTKLCGYRQHRLAHLQLGVITMGYVWEEGLEGVTRRLPKCLSIPLWHVSAFLGMKPIATYSDLCLANWKYVDDQGHTECMYQLPGAEEARWFFSVAQRVEFAFAEGINTLQNILDGLSTSDMVKVTLNLDDLATILENVATTLLKVHENLSAETFYFVLRPFFEGWGGDSSPLPDGLIYDGISEDPVKMGGLTAAQCSILEFLDILLGVHHQPEKQSFLDEMRNYMPPFHKRLLVDMENMPNNLSHFVSESEDKDLQTGYNRCLEAVTKFRSYHIQMVTKYIVMASRKKAEQTTYESLTSNKGTGGTDLLPFLKELRDDTKKKAL